MKQRKRRATREINDAVLLIQINQTLANKKIMVALVWMFNGLECGVYGRGLKEFV